MTTIATGYWSSQDLVDRFKISKRTLGRWMALEHNPFPRPTIEQKGVNNLWAIEDVVVWENSMSKAA